MVGNGKATNLATLEQIDPIYVYFNLNELDLIRLREAAKARGFKSKDINKIPVYVQLQNETNFPHQGHLDFANTSLDASMGTLEFRAILPNKDRTLLPGLFVKVKIPIGPAKQELTIPDTSVLYDQVGSYLFVVDSKNIVVRKRVKTGNQTEGRLAIISGINAKDRVIVSGLQNAVEGHLVKPITPGKS